MAKSGASFAWARSNITTLTAQLERLEGEDEDADDDDDDDDD